MGKRSQHVAHISKDLQPMTSYIAGAELFNNTWTVPKLVSKFFQAFY